MTNSVKINVNLETEWRDVEPDAQECCGCGDSIYLFTAKRLCATMLIGGQRSNLETNAFVCQSCFDMADF